MLLAFTLKIKDNKLLLWKNSLKSLKIKFSTLQCIPVGLIPQQCVPLCQVFTKGTKIIGEVQNKVLILSFTCVVKIILIYKLRMGNFGLIDKFKILNCLWILVGLLVGSRV